MKPLFLALCLAVLPLAAASEASRIDELFARYDSTRSPGCAVAVARDGKVIFKRGYGMANLDHDVPISPSTVFHVASVSKQFAAFSVMLLADEGKLSLDDEVQKHLPEIATFSHPITLRHLIHHTSGIRDQWTLLGLSGWRYSRDLISDDDVMEVVTQQRELNFEPGSQYLYSNTGYTLLALVVKRVSGKSLREFTSERVFGPLGMKHTHFRDDFTEIVKGQAYGYRPADGSFRLSVTNFDTTGATSLLTTVEDLLLWHFNFENPKVGASILPLMQTPAKLNNGEAITYAGGLQVSKYRGLPTIGHGGADAGYRADFLRFPEQRLAVACACNVATAAPGTLTRKVAEIFLEKEMEPAEAKEPRKLEGPPLEISKALEGVYWSEKDDAYRVVELRDGALYLNGWGNERKLEPREGGVFGAPNTESALRFLDTSEGVPQTLRQTMGDSDDGTLFKRVKAARLDAASAAAYEGIYQSAEIAIPYRVYWKDGKLWLSRTKRKPSPLVPLIKDHFLGEDGNFRFERNSSGKVTAMVLDAGRVKNLRFALQ